MTTKTEILKAIRAKCLDCSGMSPQEVRLCTVSRCELHPYRMGKDPSPARKGGIPPGKRKTTAQGEGFRAPA